MSKDIRKLVKQHKEPSLRLSERHEQKFLERLNEEFPKKKKSYKKLYVAASIILLVALGIRFYPLGEKEKPVQQEMQYISLGTISPEMKKIENYYLTAINYEMAGLEVTQENKALLDVYFEKISKLDADYKRLNQQLKDGGINQKTINALITNLQLRLQLLIQLKDQVDELQSKTNNNENSII